MPYLVEQFVEMSEVLRVQQRLEFLAFFSGGEDTDMLEKIKKFNELEVRRYVDLEVESPRQNKMWLQQFRWLEQSQGGRQDSDSQ